MKKISLFLSVLVFLCQILLPSVTVGAIENASGKNDIQIEDNNNTEIENNNEETQNESDLKETIEESSDVVIEEENLNSEDNSLTAENQVQSEKENTNTYEVVKKPTARLYSVNTNENHLEKEEYVQDMNQLEEIQYLVKKTTSDFEVALAKKDGSYSYVGDTNSLSEAINTAEEISDNNTTESESVPVVIDKNGLLVYSNNSMGRILKHIDGQPYYGSDKNTILYANPDKSGSTNYVNQGYVDDVPIIEDWGNVARILIGDYSGWINKDTTTSEYDMIIVPINQAYNPSYYEVINGEIYHYISYDITDKNASKGHKRAIGLAPSYLSSGVKYYSYDDKYFYTDLNTLINDYKAGNRKNSVNSNNPYYAYYLFLPFRSNTTYSSVELDTFINNNTESNSKLRGIGTYLIEAEYKYGVNASLILAVAINESGWGMSNLAQTRNNIFGIKAYDSDPNNATYFSSVESCINEFAKYMISTGYADPQDYRYYGGFLGGKNLGANVKYASDPFWGEKASCYAYQIDKYLSGNNISKLNDYNSNIVGILSSPTEVKAKNGSTLYNVSGNIRDNCTFVGVPVVLNSSTEYQGNGSKWYAINPERTTPLSMSGGSEYGGEYDWNFKGYIKSDTVKIINNINIAKGITYQTHVQNEGWQKWKFNGETSGSMGKAQRIEGIKIKLNDMPSGATIRYKSHVQNEGWQDWRYEGELSGTSGQQKRIEAFIIESIGVPTSHTLMYRAYVQNEGWQEWKTSGEVAGTTGQSKRVEAIEVKMEEIKLDSIDYRTHVQNEGWQTWRSNGNVSGTEGQAKRLEGIQIKLPDNVGNVKVKYSTHVQDLGWQDWKYDGQLSGTEGQAKRLEAIKIELVSAPAGYHVEYRVHVQNEGWQDWKRDGQIAGTTGMARRLEGIQIRIVKS